MLQCVFTGKAQSFSVLSPAESGDYEVNICMHTGRDLATGRKGTNKPMLNLHKIFWLISPVGALLLR